MIIEIDGSRGEGGGQVLRTALSLSACTGQAFRLSRIRARRDRPGLQRQHLTAVRAAAEVCGARVEGDGLGSDQLLFQPEAPRGGRYVFDIGTAGSTTLVLQTVLPPLLATDAPTELQIIGGTHNRGAPPADFIADAFLPLLRRMGARVEFEVLRRGFYPRGGGHIRVRVQPSRLEPLELESRGAPGRGEARAWLAALPPHIAERELGVVRESLGWTPDQLRLQALPNDEGPGNALVIVIPCEHVTEVFSGFGERGVPAERVAGQALAEARGWLDAPGAAVGTHLADQLLLPLALAGGGRFTTLPLTEHFRTNAEVIARFLPFDVQLHEQAGQVHVAAATASGA